MIGYMNLEEQVDADFTRARRKAYLGTLVSRLRSDPASARLSCFEEIRRALGAWGGIRLGQKVVRSTDSWTADGRVETVEAEMTKSHVAAGAEVDRLISELAQEFDLLHLRDLKAGLEREDERLAEDERLSRYRLWPTNATAARFSAVPADADAKKGEWRALAGRVALWRKVWWIRTRRGMFVEEWRRLSHLERHRVRHKRSSEPTPRWNESKERRTHE